uniref:ubiquitinyl hydrolase 1 n=5 Tax=Aegilops tauschii subsp. strangulata TaxID=200361 RepID=A0A453AHX6_AEGTS
ALSASPLRLQPPPTPIVRYTYQGQDDDDDDWPEDDGTDLDAGQEDEDELPDDEKFYIPLFMSGQKKNLPHDLFRHDSVPLNKNEYFSLWKNWNQLLDGKRTYLRPLRDRRVLSVSGVFRRPLARPWALEFQEPLLDLVEDYPDNDIVQEMIKILCQRYVHFKRTRGDGSCFYRAFFFSYLENLGQMQDSQAEVTRLMEHVAVSRENFCRLKWDKAYFLNPEEYFSSVASVCILIAHRSFTFFLMS